MKKIRFWPALWLGKLTAGLLKIIGKKATTFPGAVACKVCPDILVLLAATYPAGVVVLTGTNGKTTTNNLLASILREAGIKVAFNKEGANMLNGICSSLLQNAGWFGRTSKALLLLEVDEGTLPELCKRLTPRLGIVTNFFRDQLDRYGELDTTVKMVQKALPEETELILNADDPLVAWIGKGREKVSYYGMDRLPVSRKQSRETREGKYCLLCGGELSYELFHYGQLGKYRCPDCGFARPLPIVEGADIAEEDEGYSFAVLSANEQSGGDGERYRISFPGCYNLYNALAALAAAVSLGVDREVIRTGLASYLPDAGRMEYFTLPECSCILALVKNPTGFNQVLQTIAASRQPFSLFIAVNDLAADGRDISWLWDVNFETLAECPFLMEVVCGGLRSEDMLLRLKYAGLGKDRLRRISDLASALDDLRQTEAKKLFLLPTYTALAPLREVLVARQKQACDEFNSAKKEGAA